MNLSFSIPTNLNSYHEELESIRSQKSQRSKLLSGILDYKLREISKLQTKQQILHSCQTWMKDKVLYYMNLIDQAQVKYYLQMEELTNKLDVKQTAIQQQIKIIGDYQKQINDLGETLSQLKQSNETMERTLQRQFQFKDEDMKKYVSINKLQNTNNQLSRSLLQLNSEHTQLSDKYEKLKSQNDRHKADMGLLQNQVLRLRTRLQDQTQNDENIKYISEYKITYALSISIRPQIKQPKKMIGERILRHVMLQGLIVRNRAPREGQYVNDIFLNQGPRQRQEGTQTAPPYLWITKLKSITIGSNQMQERNLRKSAIKRQSLLKEQQLQKQKDYYRRQLMNLKKDIKRLMLQSQQITDRRFKNIIEQRDQLIDILSNRPSRQEDIEYIHTLQQQNKQLMGLSSEANCKAQTAYTAMNQLKTQLQRYKQNTTLMVRPKMRRTSNLEGQTINPNLTTFSQSHRVSWSVSKKRSRNKSRDQDILITSIIRDSLGSVDFSAKNHRKLNSSLSVYRDDFNRTIHRSVL